MAAIRRGTEVDVDGIVSMLSEVVPLMNSEGNFQWDSEYPLADDFRRDVSNGHCWVAIMGTEVAGVAALTTEQSPEYVGVGWDLDDPSVS
jgi:hypothetical protein